MVSLSINSISGVIFDIDGTLLDSMPIWNDLSSRYLISLGIKPEADLNTIMYSMTVKEGVSYLKKHYDIKLTEEEINQGILNLLKKFYYEEAQLKAGADSLVKNLALHNIPMALATTGDKDLATHALERLGLLKFFKVLLTCNEMNTNKGEPYIFYKAAEILKGSEVTEDEISSFVVVEDSLKAVITAKTVGFTTLAVEDESAREYWEQLKTKADFFVKSLEEVKICRMPEAEAARSGHGDFRRD